MSTVIGTVKPPESEYDCLVWMYKPDNSEASRQLVMEAIQYVSSNMGRAYFLVIEDEQAEFNMQF